MEKYYKVSKSSWIFKYLILTSHNRFLGFLKIDYSERVFFMLRVFLWFKVVVEVLGFQDYRLGYLFVIEV